MDSSLSHFVRIGEAANMLGVSTQTLRNWVAAGKLSAHRHPVNRYRLFDFRDLAALLAPTNAPRAIPVAPRNADLADAKRVLEPRGTYVRDLLDAAWLRLTERPKVSTNARTVRVGDAFSGGGVFSLGVDEALRELAFQPSHAFGVDFNKEAIDTFAENFPEARAIHADVLTLANGEIGGPLTPEEKCFLDAVGGQLDILIGGPPCQGHSDLNNHTRRKDPKNDLFFSMARLTELLRPSFLLIENVPGVVHDRGGVVARTVEALERNGYQIDTAVVDLSRIGVPQRRKRFVLAASLVGKFDIGSALAVFQAPERTVEWAIHDLASAYDESRIFDSSANHSAVNKRRIDYLFDQGLYDLPDAQRPPCHRDKKHSYVSVYGRMGWNKPSPTVTGGFGSTGQGRFVHPKFRRTLTPHEACRLQFIPDYFVFPERIGRRAMQQIIGNAAPPRLSQVLVLGAAAQGVLL